MRGPDAGDVELIRAATRNHIGWTSRAAVATGGAVVREHPGRRGPPRPRGGVRV